MNGHANASLSDGAAMRQLRLHWSAGLAAVTLAAAAPIPALAQAGPGTRLDVRIDVETITVNAGVVEIGYRLRNAAASSEDVFTFTVDCPATSPQVDLPAPPDAWATATRFRQRQVARWTTLDPVVPPGGESPVLGMRAAGLPGIVSWWVQGYAPPPPVTDADTIADAPPDDPLAHSLAGRTVGVEPVPANATAGALAERLIGFNTAACGSLGWISSDGVCQSLATKLTAARAAIVSDRPSAIHLIGAYINELEAQRGPEAGKHVSSEAYWLLRANAEALLTRLGAGS
jgi:hypothetical protein